MVLYLAGPNEGVSSSKNTPVNVNPNRNAINLEDMHRTNNVQAATVDQGLSDVVKSLKQESRLKQKIIDDLQKKLKQKEQELARRQFLDIMSEHNYF